MVTTTTSRRRISFFCSILLLQQLFLLPQTLVYAFTIPRRGRASSSTTTTTHHESSATTLSHHHHCSLYHHYHHSSCCLLAASNKDSDVSSPSSSSTEDSISCDVAIFGGGFGGLYTALALARRQQASSSSLRKNNKKQRLDIVLVEPTDAFVFLPLLYDLTVGTATEAEVCPLYRDLLQDTGIRHVRASLDAFASSVTGGSSEDANNKSKNKINPQRTKMMTATLKSPPSSSSSSSSTPHTKPSRMSFSACVIAVGASPESILAKTPGALKFAQPFYTAKDAEQTRKLLGRFEKHSSSSSSSQQSHRTARTRSPPPRIAIVGGGFGGVELAASVKRKLKSRGAQVTLLSRGPPMAGTRAEPLIHKALTRLGVTVQECSVVALEEYQEDATAVESDSKTSAPTTSLHPRIVVKRNPWQSSDEETFLDDSEPWDAVLWTAGSGPADPVGGEGHGLDELLKSDSGRLATDSTLRCFACDEQVTSGVPLKQPPVWALGDCAEIVSVNNNSNNQPAVPKTAQAAMQQADVVAYNVLSQHETPNGQRAQQFQYQDLGSMLMLGGPNAALMAPRDGSILAPIFTPALDTATAALGFADKILEATIGKSVIVDKFGLSPETLGLSLGSYGLGVEAGAAPGTLAGTLTGAARRAVYAARMPTNRQRAVAATSAAISTAAALVQEASSRNQQSNQ